MSQTFLKLEVARRYWGCYLKVLYVFSPDDRYWFQHLPACRK
jgi:hypothetical protein